MKTRAASSHQPLTGGLLLGLLLTAFQCAVASKLPDPLTLADVSAAAASNRAEVSAAKARAEAMAQRPAIDSALEDPMVFASIDHYPYENPMMESGRRYNKSFSIEQRFPLSGVLSHRRESARAEADRLRALANVTQLDVEQEAQRSFLMLLERRRMKQILEEQLVLARDLVHAAASRYSSGAGVQADVLRAEVEVARLKARQLSLAAQTRSAEVMLNTSLGREPQEVIPPLRHEMNRSSPASELEALDIASAKRPELSAGKAEVEKAAAEIEIMQSMYKPMAMVRVGQATTMAEGKGAMLMVGVSVPLWQERLGAGVSEANAMHRMANADLDAMQRMVAGEVLAARANVDAARTQMIALETEVIPRAIVAMDSSRAAYSSGKGTLLAAIEAARALWAAQEELVMQQTSLGEAWVSFERAMGINAGN